MSDYMSKLTSSEDFDFIQALYNSYYPLLLPGKNGDLMMENWILPSYSQKTLLHLCELVISRIKPGKPLLKYNGECFIIGDLHGNVHDLIRIIRKCGLPPNITYVFLGDFVDRGEYSIEVVTLILILYINFPDNIYIIRGNHEFRDINSAYGFKDNVESVYNSCLVWEAFNSVFDYLAFGVLINGSVLCVHGGLSERFMFLSDLEKIELPMPKCKNPMVLDILWSDPFNQKKLFSPNPRGKGVYFNERSVIEFCQRNGLKCIIRAHEYTEKGFHKMHNSPLYTVFSTTGYINNFNDAGYARIDGDSRLRFRVLRYSPSPSRSSCRFINIDVEKLVLIEKDRGVIPLSMKIPTKLINPVRRRRINSVCSSLLNFDISNIGVSSCRSNLY